MDRKAPWEQESGVQMLKLYKTELCPDLPQVVLLDLTAQQFEEFHKDPLAFAEKYKLFPPKESAEWTSHVAMPPIGKGIPHATDDSGWLVACSHSLTTVMTSAACPQSATKRKTE